MKKSPRIRAISKSISENIEPRIYPTVNKIKLDDKDYILVEFEGDNISQKIRIHKKENMKRLKIK